jgi:hypothetical protein
MLISAQPSSLDNTTFTAAVVSGSTAVEIAERRMSTNDSGFGRAKKCKKHQRKEVKLLYRLAMLLHGRPYVLRERGTTVLSLPTSSTNSGDDVGSVFEFRGNNLAMSGGSRPEEEGAEAARPGT